MREERGVKHSRKENIDLKGGTKVKR